MPSKALLILDSESSFYNITVILFMFIQILYVNIWKNFRIQGPELEMRNFLRNINKQQYAMSSFKNGIVRII